MVEQSRAIPVEVHRAFDVTLPAPLTTIFSRRFAALPPIREVRDQNGIPEGAPLVKRVLPEGEADCRLSPGC